MEIGRQLDGSYKLLLTLLWEWLEHVTITWTVTIAKLVSLHTGEVLCLSAEHTWIEKIHRYNLPVTKKISLYCLVFVLMAVKAPGKDLSLKPRPSSATVGPDFHHSSWEQHCYISQVDRFSPAASHLLKISSKSPKCIRYLRGKR